MPLFVLPRLAIRPPSHGTNTDIFETAYFFTLNLPFTRTETTLWSGSLTMERLVASQAICQVHLWHTSCVSVRIVIFSTFADF